MDETPQPVPKPLSITFEEVPNPKIKVCETDYCEGNKVVTYRWRWLGGGGPQSRRWLYVCSSCHIDLLGTHLDEAKTEYGEIVKN